jgi:mono/diheme cytochrome c family protein
MNNEIRYISQGCLLALFVILIFGNLKFLYFSSNKETAINNSNSIITDNEVVNNNSALPELALPGYKLFKENCAACHTINKRLVGPARLDVEQRGPWSDRKQVYQWVRNPSLYMKFDPYTSGLFKEYQILMTAFPDLSNKEIDAMLDYIKEASKQ